MSFLDVLEMDRLFKSLKNFFQDKRLKYFLFKLLYILSYFIYYFDLLYPKLLYTFVSGEYGIFDLTNP